MKKVILLLALTAAQSWAQFSGATFEDRKRAYINDQGRKWEDGGFGGNEIMRPLWAWLEAEKAGLSAYSADGKSRKQLISEAIDYITGPGWWGGALPGANPVNRIYYQYYHDPASRVISRADAEKLEGRLGELGRQILSPTNAVWCAVANWHAPNLVAAYLYNSKIHNFGSMQYPKPDPTYRCPPSFSYNGRSYSGGNSYDAKTILRDYLEFMMDDWLKNGTDEDLSTSDYFQYQIHAIALLVDFAPDQGLRDKARTLLDWMILQHAAAVSAGHLAGGHGRSYSNFEFSGQDSFPFEILFNLGINSITRDYTQRDLYVSSYRPPKYVVELFQSINGAGRTEGDDYYRIIRGNVPAFGRIADKQQSYRYDYITPSYNLGGTGLGTGWELNIASGGSKPMKLFFCESPLAQPDKDRDGRACNSSCFYSSDGGVTCRMYYLFSMGQRGWQHRNAVFSQGAPFLHEVLEGNAWDEQSSESGWQFFRKNKVAVAAAARGASALEVCTIGVDYPSYADFKSAVKTRAELTSDYFKTSKGVKIAEGYVDGTLPFDRLEVWEGHVGRNDEKKSVDWNNNVMTVSRNGEEVVYDFSRLASNGGPGTIINPPSTPTALKMAELGNLRELSQTNR